MLWNAIVDAFEGFSENYPIWLAVIFIIIIVLFAIGIGFGIDLLVAFLFMTVYNAIAKACSLPTFSIWVWMGIVLILVWFRKGRRFMDVNTKIKKD